MQDIDPGILFERQDESFAFWNLESPGSLNCQHRHGDIVWQGKAEAYGR